MLVSISSPVNDGILLYGWEPNTGTSVRETAVAAHRHITGEPRMMIPCYDSTTRAVRKSDSSQAEKERQEYQRYMADQDAPKTTRVGKEQIY